jgi:hypothetical protein
MIHLGKNLQIVMAKITEADLKIILWPIRCFVRPAETQSGEWLFYIAEGGMIDVATLANVYFTSALKTLDGS